ncbi:MAG TPA: sialidase family protein [Chloroflexia bacterium]|nr:sialidase family protein [Chloroflexia bacterium]
MTTLYIALEQGLLVARGQDHTWRVDQRLRDRPVQSVAGDPLRPERLYCGTFGQGVWYSADAGASWQPAGAALADRQIMAVVVSPVERAGDQGVVYAGTEPSALYRSADGGQTWQECAGLRALPSAATWSFPPRPQTHHVRAIGLAPDAPGRLYVAIEAGALVRSPDGGRTWHDRQPDGPRDAHTLATHEQAPGRVYAAAGDGFLDPGRGYAESRDGGATWQYSGAGLQHHYLWGLAVDPGDPETIVVSAASGPQQAHYPPAAESYIYRKCRGEVWRLCAAGLPEAKGLLAPVLAAHAAEPGVFYAASNAGLFRSPDAGQHWEPLPIPWPDPYRFLRIQALAVTAAA